METANQQVMSEQTIPMLQPDTGSSDLIKYMIMNDDESEKLYIQLSGKQWDSKSKKYVPLQTPMIAEEGIATILTIYQTNTGKNPTMTFFKTEERIMKIINNIWEALADVLYLKGDEWGVATHNRSIVIMMVVHAAYFTLSKGLEGNYQEMIKPTIRRTENVMTGKQGGSGIKGFLNYLSPIK